MNNPTHPDLNKNSYWSQAIQYRQRNQQQQGRLGRQQPPKQRIKEDFSEDWRGKHVVTKVVEGASVVTIEGVVEDVSRYWIKLRVGGVVLYINKAHIISIKPAEVKEPAGGDNGGEVSRQK
jgi:hypothetical protein